MASLTLQELYNELMFDEPVDVLVSSERDFNNLRTALLRKFRKARAEFVDCGFNWQHKDKFISCQFNKETGTAKFQLKPESMRATRSWNVNSQEL